MNAEKTNLMNPVIAEVVRSCEANQLCENFRHFQTSLLAFQEKHFPMRKTVRVDAPRYHGYGVVTRWDGCPADQLAVTLENGNTWFYPLDCCRPLRLDEVKNLSRADRRSVLRARGKRLI